MADYFTHFSCLLDVGCAENVARALELYRDALKDADGRKMSGGFLVTLDRDSQLWLRDDGSGDPDCVIEFVLLCAEAFDLKGLWGFEYANTCSKPRLEAFGGGAHVIDLGKRESLAWTSTNEWLSQVLQGDDPDA